jgi:hypothetical protein
VSPAATNQVSPAQEAGRPQPQTTVEAAGGPFIRHSQPGMRSQYTSIGNALGAVVQQPLVAVPGYLRSFRVRIAATGGATSGTLTTASLAADAPFSAVTQVILKDAFGTPLIVGPGYEILKLVNKYSSQGYLLTASDPVNLPSYQPINTASNSNTGSSNGGGNFVFQTHLPLEFSKAYGVISGANASVLPTLQWQFNSVGNLLGTWQTQTNVTGYEVDLDNEFYWLPEGSQIEPPGLGTTCQWIYQQCNPTIGSGATVRVQLPRLGGYLHTLIFILRDTGAGNARVNSWGSRTRIYVDGVPLIDTRDDEWLDDMYNIYGNAAATSTTATSNLQGIENGVRRTSLNQINLGLLDTGEAFLSTNPGTLIEVEGAPWGSTGTGPFQLNVVAGQIVPSGTLIQGLPEV